ncbi:Uncharacterised protein [Vibrio cholerae]|nr:Uncharacterised protein [Vibrio cholerae]
MRQVEPPATAHNQQVHQSLWWQTLKPLSQKYRRVRDE